MKNNRIESYLVLAATPAVIGGIATAEIYHYDGPSISVTTNGIPTDDMIFDTASFAFGGGSMQANLWLAVGAFGYDSFSFVGGDYGSFARFAKVGFDKTSKAKGGIINNKGDSNKKAQRFSYSNNMPSSGNFPKKLAVIGGSTSIGEGDHYTFGNFNGEGEERGYVGIFMETESSFGFGWLDIGYDFESNTLTMYDWAFNDDGDLYAGHDTPPLVPGPAGLLALAAGAAGIRRKRNRVA